MHYTYDNPPDPGDEVCVRYASEQGDRFIPISGEVTEVVDDTLDSEGSPFDVVPTVHIEALDDDREIIVRFGSHRVFSVRSERETFVGPLESLTAGQVAPSLIDRGLLSHNRTVQLFEDGSVILFDGLSDEVLLRGTRKEFNGVWERRRRNAEWGGETFEIELHRESDGKDYLVSGETLLPILFSDILLIRMRLLQTESLTLREGHSPVEG